MSAARTLLSVDLGTLRTSAALQQGDADAVLVPLGAAPAVPSTVAVEAGHIVIGDAAEAVLAVHPDRGVRELKRRFGDTTPVVLDGQAYTADTLTAEVLTAVATAAGVDPSTTSLVLSHPTGWHEYKRELLAATGTHAGFAEVHTISEAEAAVRPFIRSGRVIAGATVAVYDLGGTFEASIVGVTDSGTRVLGQAQALERLGGDVLDQVVFRHVTEALGGTLQQLDRNDPAVRSAVTALRVECAAAKERLSSDGETAIAVVAPGLDTRVRMTRDEFETAVRPLVNDTLTALDRALASAGIAATDLAAVVLAGGGSQVPVVAEMVAGHVGRPLLVDRPATAVALGAATPLLAATPLAATPAAASHSAASLAAAVPGVAAVVAALPSPSESPSITSAPREPLMSDQPSTESTAPAGASPGAGGRSIPTPPPPPGKKVSSKVTTAVGGLAAVAAAITAAVFYGDDVLDAFGGSDGEAHADAPDAETRTADRAEREAGDDSMDAFDTADAVADAPPTPTAAAAAVGTPLAPPPSDQASFDRPAPRAAHQQQQRHEQVDDDGPDLGSRPAPTAAPAGAAGAAAGAAGVAAAAGAAAAGPATNDDFEASRAQLLARLDRFEAPEGTSPEDAQALKDELRETIENFDPQPGQSADDAMADLRGEFDDTVQDFTQDQRIDALVEEAQRDNEADAAATDPAPTDPAMPPPDDATADAADDATDDATDDGEVTDDGSGSDGIEVTDADDPNREGTPDGMPDDVGDPIVDANNDGIADAVDADGDGIPDDVPTDPPSDGPPVDPTLTDPRLAQIADDQGFGAIDPTIGDPVLRGEDLREVDPAGSEVDGESTDDRHRGEIDATLSDDAGPALREPVDTIDTSRFEGRLPEVEDLNIGEAPVLEDPDAGGEISPRLSDGFDDLILPTVVSDPDMGGEATGAVIGGEAVPQVRASVDPAAVRPTMMDDLGDDTYEQVKAEADVDPAGILIGMDQGAVDPPADAPAEVDAGFLLPAVDVGQDLAAQIPEPVQLDVQFEVPISASADTDFEDDAPGLAEDLHSDITPDAPNNLDFGG